MSLTNVAIWLNTRASGNPLLNVNGSSVQERGTLNLVSGDHMPLELYLREIESDGTLSVSDLPVGGSIVFAARLISDPSIKVFQASSFVLTGEDADQHYLGDLNLNTDELNDALEDVALGAVIKLRCDIELRNNGNTRRRTLQFDANVYKQVYLGAELPTPATPPYPEPGVLLTSDLSGVYVIPETDQLLTLDLTPHALSAAPAGALLTLRAPDAYAPLLFCQQVGAATTSELVVALSAPAPEGYHLNYTLIPGVAP